MHALEYEDGPETDTGVGFSAFLLQGVALGALQAVKGLASTVGPLVFGPLFSYSSGTLHHAEITFFVAGAMVFIGYA